jgi:nickel superoxide dismutase
MKNHTVHVALIALLGIAILTPSAALAHCQIPCGIYDDDARFTLLREHITTIEKSMKTINDLESQDHAHANQLVRWVSNKDTHADALTEIVTYYFMAQRVKPAPATDKKAHAAYVAKVELLHKMVVHSMKCKQTTDVAHVEALRELVGEFQTAYKK